MRGTESGTVNAPNANLDQVADSDLAELADAWPKLADDVKLTILAVARPVGWQGRAIN